MPLLWLLLTLTGTPGDPVVVVTKDDTLITRSCVLRIPPGLVIRDAARDGVIRIRGSGLRVSFEPGSILRGSPPGTAPDRMAGTGVVIGNSQDVRVSGLDVRGFKLGLSGVDCAGLVVEKCVFQDNFRQILRSTSAREDPVDWLRPHANDQGEWVRKYGAAVLIARSREVTLREIRVRRGQNGLLLERVADSQVHDNDASFLSGWGLALWRSNHNVISRNAFDFCVRGYSHGVYNRGQDSAGILMFEQCSRNVVAENSATHCGDGVFVFAGEEALSSSKRLGCNANVFVGNDLSYAAAHGLEVTFSFDNLVARNRFRGNAICGIWGGYSQDTTIFENRFQENGELGYGTERGGVNIEHGFRNLIVGNVFVRNRCGVHLWWDADRELLKRPWARANERGSRENVIAGNSFDGDDVAWHLERSSSTRVGYNRIEGVKRVFVGDEQSRPRPATQQDRRITFQLSSLPGTSRPMGRRAALAGRSNILMTAWGPWDHEGVVLRRTGGRADRHEFEVLGASRLPAACRVDGSGVVLERAPPSPGGHPRCSVVARVPGVHAYRLRIPVADRELVRDGLLVRARWRITCFPWTRDPRSDEAGWRAEARSTSAVTFERDSLALAYGNGGPGGLEAAARGLPVDRFGTLASAALVIPAGSWRIWTLSDDGVRVKVDGRTLIDNWTWHGPARDSAVLSVVERRRVEIQVEHFELDGYSVLELGLEPETVR